MCGKIYDDYHQVLPYFFRVIDYIAIASYVHSVGFLCNHYINSDS